MTVAIEVSTGGVAQGISLVGEVLALRCDAPIAPGRPLGLVASIDGHEVQLHGKTIGSQRDIETGYFVRVRLVNLRRQDRALLEASLEGF